ncbi:MAG: PAS domain S-box protein [Bryobacteraceae bacterium]
MQPRQFLIDYASDIIFCTDIDGYFTYVNASAPVIMGRTAEELLGLHYLQLIPQGYREAAGRFYRDQLRSGTPASYYEYPAMKGDGSSIWLGQNVEAMLDENGHAVGFQAIARDITERRRAEEALRESEQRYRIVAETAMDAIVTFDSDNDVLFVNAAAEELFGYRASEMLGQKISLIMPEYPSLLLEQSLLRYVNTGEMHVRWNTLQVPGRHKSGRIIPLEVSIGELQEGDRLVFTGVLRDISERRAAEENLRKVNETLRAIIQASPVGIVGCDSLMNVTQWNSAAERIFGWSESEALNRPLPYAGKEESGEAQVVNAVLRQGGSYTVEKSCRRKDGGLAEVSISTAPLRNEDGSISGAVGMITDIAERRRLETQLRQAQKMEAIGLLAGGVAHDFNNLLTVISGYSDLLILKLQPGDRSAHYALEILQAAEQATALTRQLLAFSRRQVTQPRVLDLNSVIGNMTTLLGRLIGEDVELHTDLRALAGVKADSGQIEQIVLNLAVNARDAMPHGGRLFIDTTDVDLGEAFTRTHFGVQPGTHVRLTVTDTGSGMDEETKRRIFEPFFTTKEFGKGTGLGLSTVYGIVKQNEGTIWVYSEPGMGSSFNIYFPAFAERKEPAPILPEENSLQGTETILVVEDEAALRTLTVDLLRGRGYMVLAAAGVPQAKEICESYQGRIELVVTDVVMPRGSGRDLARWAEVSRPDMRFLYMSGYPDHTIMHHGVLDEGVAFLQKPFSEKSLAMKLRQVLDSTSMRSSAAPSVLP